MSQKRRLFWDISERSWSGLSQWRFDWYISKTSHAGWGILPLGELVWKLDSDCACV